MSPFPAPSNPNPGFHDCRYTVEVAHIWEQFSPCLIFYVQRLACQGTSHLRACRGWTVQKTFTGTYCSLLIREGTGEFPGKQMLGCSNSCFSLTPFYWGKVDVQLDPTQRRQKTLREILWSSTVTLEHGTRPIFPSQCSPGLKVPWEAGMGGMPRSSLLRMPRSAWGRQPARQGTQRGVQLRGDPVTFSTGSQPLELFLRKELPGGASAHSRRETWGSLGV